MFISCLYRAVGHPIDIILMFLSRELT